MTQEQIFGIVRHFLTGIGAILIAKGLVEDGVWSELMGTSLSLAGLIWSIVSKKKAA